MMRQAIHRDLDLGRHGLMLVPYLGTVNFGDGDERLFSYHDEERATSSSSAFAARRRRDASLSRRT